MKNNSGITIITLVITIIVIVLIASITIYSGLDAVDTIRTKEAKDTTNAIYLALIANEDIVPSGYNDGTYIADHDTITRALTNKDYQLMGLDYSTDNFTLVFDKSFDTTTSKVTYNFTYTNSLNKVYDNITYSNYIETSKMNTKVEFDSSANVNRPIIITGIKPIGYDGDEIQNVYLEKWYNYEKNASHLAVATYSGKTFVWIPRFAYKIQDFYLYKSYSNVPSTAIDIVFLREDTSYMPNNEVVSNGYMIHPAFSNGEAGFWIETDAKSTGDIDDAKSESENILSGNSYFMRNSEYAAAVLLTKYLNNNQIIFDEKEYVAAVCDTPVENFDVYYTAYNDANNITNVLGHAMVDTPWDLKAETVLPDANLKYIVREPTNYGEFYFRSSDGNESAYYRSVLKK